MGRKMGVAAIEQWKCTARVGEGQREQCSLGRLQHKDHFSLANNSGLATGMNSPLAYISSSAGRAQTWGWIAEKAAGTHRTPARRQLDLAEA